MPIATFGIALPKGRWCEFTTEVESEDIARRMEIEDLAEVRRVCPCPTLNKT